MLRQPTFNELEDAVRRAELDLAGLQVLRVQPTGEHARSALLDHRTFALAVNNIRRKGVSRRYQRASESWPAV